jgi:hypothetical protein
VFHIGRAFACIGVQSAGSMPTHCSVESPENVSVDRV